MAAEFRAAMQDWAGCMSADDDEAAGDECGDRPHPRDFGLTVATDRAEDRGAPDGAPVPGAATQGQANDPTDRGTNTPAPDRATQGLANDPTDRGTSPPAAAARPGRGHGRSGERSQRPGHEHPAPTPGTGHRWRGQRLRRAGHRQRAAAAGQRPQRSRNGRGVRPALIRDRSAGCTRLRAPMCLIGRAETVPYRSDISAWGTARNVPVIARGRKCPEGRPKPPLRGRRVTPVTGRRGRSLRRDHRRRTGMRHRSTRRQSTLVAGARLRPRLE